MTFPCLNISLGELQKASGREISGQWGTSVEVKRACSSSVYSGCSSERLSYRLWFSMACGNLFPHDLTCLKVLIGKFRSFTVLWASLTNHFCISIWAFSVRSYTCLKKATWKVSGNFYQLTQISPWARLPATQDSCSFQLNAFVKHQVTLIYTNER